MFGIYINYDRNQAVLDVHQFNGQDEIEQYEDMVADEIKNEPVGFPTLDAAILNITIDEEHNGEWAEAIEFVKELIGNMSCEFQTMDFVNDTQGVWIVCDHDPIHPIEPDSVTSFLN